MTESFLSNKNLKEFIEKLRIDEDQKIFLLDEVARLDAKERLELLDTLKDIYLLNEEEDLTLKKIKDNFK